MQELRRAASENALPLHVYTSTLPRSAQTVAPLLEKGPVASVEQHSSLNMLDTGRCPLVALLLTSLTQELVTA